MPERKKTRSRLGGVRVGRSPAAGASSSSSPSSRRRGSGSGGRRLRLSVRPAEAASRSRPPRREKGKGLARSASEPELWSGARVHPLPRGPSPPPPPLERPHTCFDVFTPDSPLGHSPSAASLSNGSNRWEDAKVVVSVTVEGSVGPVKAMVKLGASVGDAIAAVVERYRKEGRSPRLDPVAEEAFQLHHSHFSLESLNKNDKIGDVGGRNFYLHKNAGNNGLHLQSEESGVNLSGGEITKRSEGQIALAPYHHNFFSIVIKKIDKLGRLTKRIWRVLTCN